MKFLGVVNSNTRFASEKPQGHKVIRIKNKYFKSLLFFQEIYVQNPEITVFATLPHTHLLGNLKKGVKKFGLYSYLKKNLAKYLGIEFYSTVVRNGKEITYLAENKYYDFNFQFLNFLTKPVKLQKVMEALSLIFSNLKLNFKF